MEAERRLVFNQRTLRYRTHDSDEQPQAQGWARQHYLGSNTPKGDQSGGENGKALSGNRSTLLKQSQSRLEVPIQRLSNQSHPHAHRGTIAGGNLSVLGGSFRGSFKLMPAVQPAPPLPPGVL